MKILHICLASFYIDNFSYQENLLSKFHKNLGYEVEILASLLTYNKEGVLIEMSEATNYVNEFGIPVTRLEYKKNFRTLRRYKKTKESIDSINPDIIFIHGCQFMDIDFVVKFAVQNPTVKIYVDNHADFGNSARNFLSKNILHKIIWRMCSHKILPFTEKFYGVLPNRVDFLREVYKLPSEKIDLLLMGADDEEVYSAITSKSINSTRSKLGIDDEDFLIVTGGKITAEKLNVFNLMEAVERLNNPKIKLVIFGSITSELQEEIEKYQRHKSIQHIGWMNSTETYRILAAADLVVFPDKHSVLWEQVVPLGVPLMVSYINGATHIDIGGNCVYLYNQSIDEIYKNINNLIINTSEYLKMKNSAMKKERKEFLYSKIALKSISN